MLTIAVPTTNNRLRPYELKLAALARFNPFTKELLTLEKTVLEELYHWFGEYVKSFYTADEEIQAKIEQKEQHSFLVADYCKDLSRTLGMSDADTRLAEAIGLFHDTGRFKQVTVYRTFRDVDSINHGPFGVEQLQAEGIHRKLAAKEWEAIAFAVSWHNAVSIPLQVDERLTTFTKIVRDADKLDIYRVLPPDPTIGRCTPKLITDMLAGKPLYYEDIKTTDDRKLIMVNWLYDVNYPWTLQRIESCGYINRLFAALPDSPSLSTIRKQVDELITKKTSQTN